MKLIYDTQADALDISLAEGIVVRTEEIDSATFVDLDEHGGLLSIEVLGPARPWPLEEILERFAVEDEVADTLRAIRGTPVRLTLTETEPLVFA